MNPGSQDLPRLLLVEDDPVSASFLHDAAASLPAWVDMAASIATAIAMAAPRAHDLYLIDANLPDGRGETLLHELRGRSIDTPALAHTAARDEAVRERLLAAGFVEVLSKPLRVGELHEALCRHLGVPAPSGGRLPAWDDAAALSALGGLQAHVDALRDLFLKELPMQRERIQQASAIGDEASVLAELHRLAASCGFVGAARLGDAVRALQAQPLDRILSQRFGLAVGDLLGSA